MDSSRMVRTDQLTKLQLDTIRMILDVLPCCEFSQYMHELLWHTAQIIEGKKALRNVKIFKFLTINLCKDVSVSKQKNEIFNC